MGEEWKICFLPELIKIHPCIYIWLLSIVSCCCLGPTAGRFRAVVSCFCLVWMQQCPSALSSWVQGQWCCIPPCSCSHPASPEESRAEKVMKGHKSSETKIYKTGWCRGEVDSVEFTSSEFKWTLKSVDKAGLNFNFPWYSYSTSAAMFSSSWVWVTPTLLYYFLLNNYNPHKIQSPKLEYFNCVSLLQLKQDKISKN